MIATSAPRAEEQYKREDRLAGPLFLWLVRYYYLSEISPHPRVRNALPAR